MYQVYNTEELTKHLDNVQDNSEDVITFFKNFSFSTIVNQNLAKGNSAYVFKNAIKEDTTKSKIIQLLNKLHQQNIGKITTMIREIIFQTQEEINELVNQCIQKIKKDNDMIRPLVATLCWELQLTYFTTSNKEKIYFRKLLLTEVKNDYEMSIKFNNDNWTKDKAEKTMLLIGTLFNAKIIESKILEKIIDDFKKNISFNENGSHDDYEIVEKSIQLLSSLVSSIILNEESKKLYNNLDVFLEEQVNIYEDKKCISKKVRLICRNVISELRKNIF